MGPEVGLWENWEVVGGASNRRELKVGRPRGPREESGVDSGILTLVCPLEPRCALNMEHQAPSLEREGRSSACKLLAVYHVSYHIPGYCPIQVGKPGHTEGKWPWRSHRAEGISSLPPSCEESGSHLELLRQ